MFARLVNAASVIIFAILASMLFFSLLRQTDSVCYNNDDVEESCSNACNELGKYIFVEFNKTSKLCECREMSNKRVLKTSPMR